MLLGGVLVLIGLFLGGVQLNLPGMNKIKSAALSIESHQAEAPSQKSELNPATQLPANQTQMALKTEDSKTGTVVGRPLEASHVQVKAPSEESPVPLKAPIIDLPEPKPRSEPAAVSVEKVPAPQAETAAAVTEFTSTWDYSTLSLKTVGSDFQISGSETVLPQEITAPEPLESEETTSQPAEPEDLTPPAAGVSLVPAAFKPQPKTRRVVAKRGDTLTKIIIQNYGDFSLDKLQDVLKENPEIRNPNWIMEGQALNLPGLK
jgi:hypothetical protein